MARSPGSSGSTDDRHLGAQVVRRVEERAAAARGDLVRRAGRGLRRRRALARVAGVVVQVAGQGELEVDARWGAAGCARCRRGCGRRSGRARAAVQRGHRRGQDELGRLATPRRPLAEEVELGLVDEHVELDVDAPQPPAVRQLDREVAAALAGAPAADPAVLAEQAQEPGEPVVPVVVAGDGVHGGVVAHRPGQCGPERPLEPVLVVLGAGARVHLVAAEHQDVAAGQRRCSTPSMPTPSDRRASVWRHRHRRLEAVAGVGHVVDPQPRRGSHSVRSTVRCLAGLELALVEERAEHRGEPHVQARPRQRPGAEPPDRLLRGEPQVDVLEAAGSGWRRVVCRNAWGASAGAVWVGSMGVSPSRRRGCPSIIAAGRGPPGRSPGPRGRRRRACGPSNRRP